jgi:hypothetical protein
MAVLISKGYSKGCYVGRLLQQGIFNERLINYPNLILCTNKEASAIQLIDLGMSQPFYFPQRQVHLKNVILYFT